LLVTVSSDKNISPSPFLKRLQHALNRYRLISFGFACWNESKVYNSPTCLDICKWS